MKYFVTLLYEFLYKGSWFDEKVIEYIVNIYTIFYFDRM